jgi:hypothetical protein
MAKDGGVLTDASDTPVGFKKRDGSEIMIPYSLSKSGVAVSCPADTTEDILASIPIAAGVVGPMGWFRILTMWSFTNSVNNKTLRVRLGGIGGTIHMSVIKTTTTAFRVMTDIINRGLNNSQVGSSLGVDAAAVTAVTFATGAIDLSAASSIVITGQKATAGETLTLDGYGIEVFAGDLS